MFGEAEVVRAKAAARMTAIATSDNTDNTVISTIDIAAASIVFDVNILLCNEETWTVYNKNIVETGNVHLSTCY